MLQAHWNTTKPKPKPPPPTPKGQDKWDSSLSPTIPINWNLLYKNICNSPVPHKWNQSYWLFLSRSFFLGSTAQATNWDGISHDCARCLCLETHNHLFLECPMATRCWSWIRDKWIRLFHAPPPPSSPFISTSNSLWPILVCAAIYTLWTTRCKRVYGNKHLFAFATQHTPQQFQKTL